MLVVSLVSLPQASPHDQQASTRSLAPAQHETPAPTLASRKQIARRLYEDALAWEQGKQSRETGGQNVAVALERQHALADASSGDGDQESGTDVGSDSAHGSPALALGRKRRLRIEDPHFRSIPGCKPTNCTMPDTGSFPAAMIAGQGKCGTNALAEALYRLNYNYPLTQYSIAVEEARQGWSGEVNWPHLRGCSDFETKEGIAEYKQLFSPVGGFGYKWLDKSTANGACAREIATAFPEDTKFFNIMCDPVMAVWSRMNQLRQVYGKSSSDPTELEYVLKRRLSSDADCSELSQSDKRLEQQRELCYQLEDGLQVYDFIHEWKKHLGNRTKFLLGEQSKQDRSYLVREAARHLGVPQPENDQIGDVHTHVEETSYLEPEGPKWDAFIDQMRPVFRPLIEKIAREYSEDFPLVRTRWQSVF